jgi:hypothetical protein
MVHANNPLRPGEVLDRLSDVSKLPVHDCADCVILDQHVLWSEVAMDNDGSGSRQAGHGGGRKLLDGHENLTEKSEHLGRATCVDHFLAVRTGHVPNDEQRYGRISFNRFRDRKQMSQTHQARVLAIGSREAVGPLVSLLDPAAREPACEVRVSVGQATHAAIVPARCLSRRPFLR